MQKYGFITIKWRFGGRSSRRNAELRLDMKKTSCPDLASIRASFDAEMLTPFVSNEEDTMAILFLFTFMYAVCHYVIPLTCYIIYRKIYI
ncbi:MAG: hypothetical protein A2X48_14305 [Lentisphaerae bacterium GWF2_49_21]|nr:MAG: hypothetical protein A2X48_14305 [Lentisphaerae bacterium GWF2_49_21]